MSRTAAASRGNPAASESSTAWITRLSIISRVAGMMPARMMAETVSPAASMESNTASIVRTVSGDGTSSRPASVQMPSVPSLPMNSPTRSYPGRSGASPPSRTTEPSARTTLSQRTWLRVTPYLRQCGPPAPSATLPPMEQAFPLAGSGA